MHIRFILLADFGTFNILPQIYNWFAVVFGTE